MKHRLLKGITAKKALKLFVCLIISIASCKGAPAQSLDDIRDMNVRSYAEDNLRLGAPSLNTVARSLYREASEELQRGETDSARRKFLLARELSDDFALPSMALARMELRRADPDFIIYFFDAVSRQAGSFYKTALTILNLQVLLISVTGITLFLYLVVLLVKYSVKLNHKLSEMWGGKSTPESAKYFGVVLLAALVLLRPGLAVYALLLMTIAWIFANRKEKSALVILTLMIGLPSVFSAQTNFLLPAIDEQSVTRRLSLINESPANGRLIEFIEEIDSPLFEAEKNFALGTLMYRIGDLDAAREYLRLSVSARKDFAPAYINLGNVYFKLGDFDKALTGYRNASAIDSTNAVAQYNIGQTCIKKMHFSLASSALKKAGKFGIEDFKKANPALFITNPEVITSGFGILDLAEISARESRAGGTELLEGILRPWILVPFSWLWIFLALGMISGFAARRAVPGSWKVTLCDNCDNPICPECRSGEAGIELCNECARIIDGLSSVKVMEALLRHRRQKVSAKNAVNARRMARVLPGGPQIFTGKTFSGLAAIFTGAAAVLLLVWKGFLFKDPRCAYYPLSLWKAAPLLSILGIQVFINLKLNIPGRSKSYNILPQEIHLDQRKDSEKDEEVQRVIEKTEINNKAGDKEDSLETFLDRL